MIRFIFAKTMFPKMLFLLGSKLHAKSAIKVQKNGLKNLLRPTRASLSQSQWVWSGLDWTGKQRTEVQESGWVFEAKKNS